MDANEEPAIDITMKNSDDECNNKVKCETEKEDAHEVGGRSEDNASYSSSPIPSLDFTMPHTRHNGMTKKRKNQYSGKSCCSQLFIFLVNIIVSLNFKISVSNSLLIIV